MHFYLLAMKTIYYLFIYYMKTSPHFDIMCDLLLNRRGATWNQFVLYDKKIVSSCKMGDRPVETLNFFSGLSFQ